MLSLKLILKLFYFFWILLIHRYIRTFYRTGKKVLSIHFICILNVHLWLFLRAFYRAVICLTYFYIFLLVKSYEYWVGTYGIQRLKPVSVIKISSQFLDLFILFKKPTSLQKHLSIVSIFLFSLRHRTDTVRDHRKDVARRASRHGTTTCVTVSRSINARHQIECRRLARLLLINWPLCSLYSLVVGR